MENEIYMTLAQSGQFRYVYGGKFTSRENWIHPVISCDTWELIYMIRGCAYLYEDRTRIVANAGDCVLFRPHTEHGGYHTTAESVSFFWVHGRFCPTNETDSAAFSHLPLLARHMQHTQIPIFMRQLLQFSEIPTYPPSMANALLGMLFTEYDIATAAKEDRMLSDEGRLINDITEYIRMNARTPLTAAAVAAHFGYHEDYLARLFRRVRGIGLKTQIDRLRMNHIRTQLLSTDANLKSIAAQSGFEDYKAFLKYFTYHEGITPTELRERFFKTHTNNH